MNNSGNHGRSSPWFYPSENPQILMELLGICPGAIEKTWPICCLFFFFPKHILYFSQCISSRSMKSLKQKLKILQDNECWLIFLFSIHWPWPVPAFLLSLFTSAFLALNPLQCLQEGFLWILRRRRPPAKVGMVMDVWPWEWKISVHWGLYWSLITVNKKKSNKTTPKLRSFEVFLWLFCLWSV